MIILYIALGFSSLTILLFNGMRFIIYLLIICICTDVFAYLFGIRFGKHKMVPHISPKKTWEGALGGTFFGTLIGSLFAIFYESFSGYFVANGDAGEFFFGVFDFDNVSTAVNVIMIIGLSFVLSVFPKSAIWWLPNSNGRTKSKIFHRFFRGTAVFWIGLIPCCFHRSYSYAL